MPVDQKASSAQDQDSCSQHCQSTTAPPRPRSGGARSPDPYKRLGTTEQTINRLKAPQGSQRFPRTAPTCGVVRPHPQPNPQTHNQAQSYVRGRIKLEQVQRLTQDRPRPEPSTPPAQSSTKAAKTFKSRQGGGTRTIPRPHLTPTPTRKEQSLQANAAPPRANALPNHTPQAPAQAPTKPQSTATTHSGHDTPHLPTTAGSRQIATNTTAQSHNPHDPDGSHTARGTD